MTYPAVGAVALCCSAQDLRGSDLPVVGARRRKSGIGLQLSPVGHAVLHHSAYLVVVTPHE